MMTNEASTQPPAEIAIKFRARGRLPQRLKAPPTAAAAARAPHFDRFFAAALKATTSTLAHPARLLPVYAAPIAYVVQSTSLELKALRERKLLFPILAQIFSKK
jgi:hypothetical protein